MKFTTRFFVILLLKDSLTYAFQAGDVVPLAGCGGPAPAGGGGDLFTRQGRSEEARLLSLTPCRDELMALGFGFGREREARERGEREREREREEDPLTLDTPRRPPYTGLYSWARSSCLGDSA